MQISIFLHSTTPTSSPGCVAGTGYFPTEGPGDEVVTALKVVILLLLITCEMNIDQKTKSYCLLETRVCLMITE